MSSGRSPWRWALYASVPLLVTGTIVTATARDRSVTQRIGIGVFVASAAVYAAARIATAFGRRPK